jgi:HK97 gp10 family phage protein
VRTITITIPNLDAVQKAITQYGLKAELEVSKALNATGTSIVNGVKKQMRSSKSGRRYKRGRSGVHIASAPYEAPAVDTGILINRSMYETKINNLHFVVGSNVKYSEHLEFGTRKMAARPFLRQSVINRQSEIKQILSKFMR